MRPSRIARPVTVLAALLGAAGYLAFLPGGGLSTNTAAVPAQGAVTPELPARPGCSIGAGPLTLDGQRVTFDLLNNASATASLASLEIGWSGEAELVGASIDIGAGPILLFDGQAKSPAFLVSTAEITLEARSVATVELAFEGPVAADSLGPLVAAFREGCLVAVRPELGTECPLRVDSPVVPPTLPNDIRIEVDNQSDEVTELVGLRLTWPQSSNGSVLAIGIDDTEIATFEPGRVTSPAYLDLRKLLPEPVIIDGQGSIVLRARFERPVSDVAADYSVAVDDGAGCSAGASPVDATRECGIRLTGLSPSNESVRLDLLNLDSIPRTLTGLELFWPDSTFGSLQEVRSAGGDVLWTGEASVSPARLPLTSRAIVPAQGRSSIQLIFKAPPTEGSGTLSSGDFTVAAYFSGGCQAVISTRTGERPGCSISAGDFSVDENRALVRMANAGADAYLTHYALTWPSENGPLLGVSLDGETLWEGTADPRSATQSLPADETTLLARGSRSPLAFDFESAAEAGPYSLSLSFSDAAGAPCDALLVSAAPPEASCQLGLGAAEVVDLRYIEIPVINDGPDKTRLQYAQVDWPSDGVNGLLLATLVNPAGSAQVLHGPRALTQTPVRLVPEMPTHILPGRSVLRLQFTGLLSDSDAASLAVDVVGDGCQASLRPSGRDVVPVPERFTGSISALPPGGEGLYGTWTVVILEGNKSVEREVWVDSSTRLDPPNVGPEIGDRVTVNAVRDADERYRALQISFQRAAFVEFVGTVTDMEPASARWIEVDGRVVHVRDAIVEGKLEVGVVVRVNGMTNGDGSVTAMRVSVIDQNIGEYTEFRGVIQSVREDPQTPGLRLWIVDDRAVRVLPSIVANPTGEDPAPGTRVHVKGRLQGRVVSALTTSDTVRVLPPLEPRSIVGSIVSLPDGLVGQWGVRGDDGQSYAIDVASAVIVDARTAPAAVGARVRVTVMSTDGGRLEALRIRTDWSD